MTHASTAAARTARNDVATKDDPAAEPDTDALQDQPSADGFGEVTSNDDETEVTRRTFGQRWPAHRLALLMGAAIVIALGAVGGWLGWQRHNYHQVTEERAAFLQAARQGALNLTTIDWHHPDADVQRILDSATGTFYDDFSKRSAPFIDVVKQTQSTSKGTVVSAGVQSEAGNAAQVLVAVKVDISNTAAAQQSPRSWRMQLTVQKVGDDVKVSDVKFVP